MPYILAPSWKGQVLPPGALGYPANHPNVYSYARPKYYAGRGFAGWRRGVGQASAGVIAALSSNAAGVAIDPTWTPACNPSTIPACSWSDWLFGVSAPCAAAWQTCFYGTGPGGGAALNVAGSSSGAGPAPAVALTNPSDVATVNAAQLASNAGAMTGAQVATAAANACPAGTTAQSDGFCCPPGQNSNGDGTCSTPGLPTWAWFALAGVGLLLVVR